MEELKVILRQKRKKYRLIAVLCSIFFFIFGSFSTLLLYNHFFGGVFQKNEITPFQQAYEIIKNDWYYGTDEITESYFVDAMKGLANGNVSSSRIDPYLRYYPKEDTSNKTYGIGVQVLLDSSGFPVYDGYFYITKVYGYSSAHGILKEGDLISKVNGESVRYKNSNELKIKGEKDTPVTISYIRDGQEYTHTFNRQECAEDTVRKELHTDYAILYISGFETNKVGQLGTAELAKKYLEEIKKEGIKNLVLDLRNNPGGYIAAFKELSDLFLESNISLGTYINKHQEVIEAPKTKSNQKYDFDEIIILIDGNSASAAESFTAAMKDNLENVTVCGTTSYKKGIAQRTISLADGSSLKYTYAEYLRPNGEKVHQIGVNPDVKIELKNIQLLNKNDYIHDGVLDAEQYGKAYRTYYDSYLTARKEQLNTAVALLKDGE